MVINFGAAAARLAGWTVDYQPHWDMMLPVVHNAVGDVVWRGPAVAHKDDDAFLCQAWQKIQGWKKYA